MNIKECARRMRKAGRWMTFIPVGITILAAVADAINTYRSFGGYEPNPGMLELFAFAVPGALLWLAGWIFEGLAQDAK
ncbi:MAG: hypothetical protein P4K94_06575 [Terracidiphilus sp.]|nr:hypothetical protein [Terracidiphilus sp.]